MFNIIKCYKVKKTALTKVSNHTHRTNLTEAEKKRINGDLSKKNILLHGNNVSLDVRARIKAYVGKTRKDAVYAEQYIISASPEFFKSGDLNEWVKSQLEFLKSEFGPNFTTAMLHLDETTPHIEAFVTPICKNKSDNIVLSRKMFNEQRGGLKSFKMLQDRHYEHNKQFGLKRGISKEVTELTYDELKDYYEDAKRYSNEFLGYKPPKIDDLVPKKGLIGYKLEDIVGSIKKALEVNSKVFQKALKAVQFYKKQYVKLIKERNIAISEKDELSKKYEELELDVLSIKKTYKTIVSKYQTYIELGKKAYDLNMAEEIEQRFENAQEKKIIPDSTLKKDKKNLFDIGGL